MTNGEHIMLLFALIYSTLAFLASGAIAVILFIGIKLSEKEENEERENAKQNSESKDTEGKSDDRIPHV